MQTHTIDSVIYRNILPRILSWVVSLSKQNLQREKINQFNIDREELEFLRLNLEFGHKCRKSNKLFQKSVGFEPGSDEYKKCVLNKGVIIND